MNSPEREEVEAQLEEELKYGPNRDWTSADEQMLWDALIDQRMRIGELEAELAKITERRFPLQRGPSVPWSVIAPHEAQAQHNHSQTLQRLAERGGLSPGEFWFVMHDQDWRAADWKQAEIDGLALANRANGLALNSKDAT